MEAFEPAFDYVSPGLSAPTKVGELILTHYNTRMRLFEPPLLLTTEELHYLASRLTKAVLDGDETATSIAKKLKAVDEAPSKGFNHVEHDYTDEEGRNRTVGIAPTDEIWERFRSLEYPALFMPYVDQGTYQWAVNQGMKHIWEETDGIGIEHGTDDPA